MVREKKKITEKERRNCKGRGKGGGGGVERERWSPRKKAETTKEGKMEEEGRERGTQKKS